MDALVRSDLDAGERYQDGDLTTAPDLVVATERSAGGDWQTRDGSRGRCDAVEPPGPVRDTYGCGDAFAEDSPPDSRTGLGVAASLDLAARCGAWVASLDGPYGRQAV